jgi:hypothetical protein
VLPTKKIVVPIIGCFSTIWTEFAKGSRRFSHRKAFSFLYLQHFNRQYVSTTPYVRRDIWEYSKKKESAPSKGGQLAAAAKFGHSPAEISRVLNVPDSTVRGPFYSTQYVTKVPPYHDLGFPKSIRLETNDDLLIM